MIIVRDIEKSYGRKKVLKGVEMDAGIGEQIAITGRNGSGKSTLLQIMAGVIRPDSGTVSCFGHDIIKERGTAAKYCGYLPQGDCLMEELSVADNLSLWSGKREKSDTDLVDFFDLKDILKTPVRKLSGGMKRRVSIACAVSGWPPVLLLDEPSNGLDRYYKREIRDFMEKFRKLNGILVIITHDEEEIKRSSRCLELVDGKFSSLNNV